MHEYQMVYMVPRYRTLRARDLKDAGRQARMIIDEMNQVKEVEGDAVILLQVTVAAEPVVQVA